MIRERVEGSRGSEGKLKKLDFANVSFNEFFFRVQGKLSLIPESMAAENAFLAIVTFLSQCRIFVDDSELKSLKKRTKLLTQSYSNISSAQIVALLNDWYHASHTSQDLRTKIMKTIQEFESLKSDPLTIDEKSSLDNLVYSLKVQLKKVPSKAPSKTEEIKEKSKCGLSEIFKHYSKQQFLLGKAPTFENIQKNLEVWNQAKFIKFCKDFEIVEINPTEREQRKKVKWIQKVFKKNSDFNKDMHEHQFFAAIETIAEIFIGPEYDQKHATNWSHLPVNEKVLKFYEIMGFADPGIYKKKTKDTGLHFGTEASSRIPSTDPSKHYKYDAEKYRKLKMSVDEWKSRKIEEAKKLETKNPVPKIQSKKSTRKADCYSSKNSEYIKTRRESIHSVPKQEEFKPFTFQRIQGLKLEELSKADKEFNVQDLVDDSEDEFLSKYLHKPQESEGKHGVTKSVSSSYLPPNKEVSKFPLIIRKSDHQLGRFVKRNK